MGARGYQRAALGDGVWGAGVSGYRAFLDGKHVQPQPSGISGEFDLNGKLFGFQRQSITRALNAGKFALFTECGSGKTAMQAEWARQVCRHTGGDALILAPLAVTAQTVGEGAKFGVEITQCRSQKDVRRGVNVANYDMLKHFDAGHFDAVVLDESSILKNFTGATRRLLQDSFASTPYKLCCSATPSPNDHMELGNHSEFLDIMSGGQMLMRWFLNDTMKAGGYRLKGHAEADYWRWVASWSVCMEKPSDLGFSDDGWVMPALNIHEEIVSVDQSINANGQLFRVADVSATGLHREMRLTAPTRAARVAEIIGDSTDPWCIWCNTNYEADELMRVIDGAIEVRGDERTEAKEEKLLGFTNGAFQRIVTKPSIAGFGMNWQHCNKHIFCGLSYSYEQFYQAVRRSWRFGQTRPVDAYMVIAETEGPVLKTIRQKQKKHEEMKAAMVHAMAAIQNGTGRRQLASAVGTKQMNLPRWI